MSFNIKEDRHAEEEIQAGALFHTVYAERSPSIGDSRHHGNNCLALAVASKVAIGAALYVVLNILLQSARIYEIKDLLLLAR
jgi:hypothetical protein